MINDDVGGGGGAICRDLFVWAGGQAGVLGAAAAALRVQSEVCCCSAVAPLLLRCCHRPKPRFRF